MALQLKVPNIAYSACVDTVTKAVKGVDPTAQVEADPKTKLVSVETQQPEKTVREAIASAGYPVA